MKRLFIFLLLVPLVFSRGADVIALAMKVSGQVTVVNQEKQTLSLKAKAIFYGGEVVQSKSDGLAVIVYIDDKSMVKIQKNTTVTISGERTADAISKTIDMQFGKLKAEISAQRKGEFVIATPISVASVKGTAFWATSDPVLGDIFLGLEGLIEVLNLISGGTIEVSGGQMGTSNPDGSTAVTTFVLLVGELLSISDNLLTMEPAGEGEAAFNGQIILVPQTTYAGPEVTAGSVATIAAAANEDGSVTAIQVVIEVADEAAVIEALLKAAAEAEEVAGAPVPGVPNELRIQLEDANGALKEVIIIYQ